ncbi:MAG: NADH-quinone oxidoreductase subunit NuoH [Chloroflexota bacterium]|nr:NADH-quinone oxidoreductase subunit NuoH [Chloroflexota bacterium]
MDAWDVVILAVKVLVFFVVFFTSPMIWVLAERKYLGRVQARYGPNRVGPWGVLQTLVDGLKLGVKEDIIPPWGDKVVFWLAPLFMVVPAATAWAVIPLGPRIELGREIELWIVDLNVALLFVLALGSLNAYGPVMSGWSSNSKYAHFGSLRSSAQVISYEISLGLAILGVLMYAGSFSLIDIVESQKHMWHIVPQLLGFLIFLISVVAETNRVPFDLPEAETEIVAGYHVEYSGMRWAFFFMAEYANMLLSSFLVAILFLGGWNGWTIPGAEGLSGILWIVGKALVVMFLYILLRGTLPRLRYDQLMGFCWKILLPAGVVNLALATVMRIFWS